MAKQIQKKGILLPAQFDNLSLRKDGSVTLKFETRELTGDEIQILLEFRNSEGYVQYSLTEEFEKTPDEAPNLDLKSKSERLRNAMYVRFKEKKVQGVFDNYYNTRMEQYIQNELRDVKNQ